MNIYILIIRWYIVILVYALVNGQRINLKYQKKGIDEMNWWQYINIEYEKRIMRCINADNKDKL